jgi:hypothetical protein
MPKTTLIHVTKTDNELYLLALPANALGSEEIGHIKSGFNNLVEYQVVPQSVLTPGEYTLLLVGINWGGPTQFSVTLTTGGVVQSPIQFGAGNAIGVSSALGLHGSVSGVSVNLISTHPPDGASSRTSLRPRPRSHSQLPSTLVA